MQHAGHGLAGRLGIAVGDRDRMVLVQAEDDARIFIAEVVNDAVVESPVARPWVEADERNAKTAQHLRGDIAAPSDFVIGLPFNSVEFHFFTSALTPSERPK